MSWERDSWVQQEDTDRRRPLLLVLGASITAGVGAESPGAAWPRVLASLMDWRLVADGVPGAGFLSPGGEGRGPFSRQLAGLGLADLDPSVVIVQGGRNDVGQPLPELELRVVELFTLLARQAPQARLGLISVFPGAELSSEERSTNEVIVRAARQAVARIIVFDPINERWRFPTVEDGVHPTTAGHRCIAEWVAARLGIGGAAGDP